MSLLLPAVAITVAQPSPGVAGPVLKALGPGPFNLGLEAEFDYGTGGTSVDAYVQTSFDMGVSWIDVAEFHFTTASANAIFNLSSLTPQTMVITPKTLSMASNTCQDGVFGDRWQVVVISDGTYTGTTLAVFAHGIRLTQ